MNLRPTSRAFVPVLALAVLAGIVATFMVYRTLPGSSSEADLPTAASLAKHPKPVKPAKPAKKTAPAATKAKAPAKPKPKAVVKPKPKPAVVPAQAPAPVRQPVEPPKGDPVDANGLPLVLSRALAKNPVTVVALYDPKADLDSMALAEARAGAAEVKAGFLAISVFNEKQVRPLAELLGVLNSPSVLVYKRPSTLFLRVDGFSDRETVAQAAANARR
jgi:outer membrane biosynthesis protein TonB